MKNKRLIITSVISIILVSTLLIGSTYSIFTTGEVDDNLNVYKTANLDITYTVSDNNQLMANSTPIDSRNSIIIKPYRLTVTNNGVTPYKFNIILNDTTASNSINHDYIMTQVGKLEPISLSAANNVIKSDILVLPNDSVDVDVRVWISDTISNSEMGKSFYANLSIEGIATYNYENTDSDEDENNYEDLIAEVVAIDTDINFDQISSDTNGKGLYVRSGTENTSHPIYYFRGEVDNNNVIFADMCFKIVRTTETGGIKLVYNGLPTTDGKCDNTGTASQLPTNMAFNSDSRSLAYVGYMYGADYQYATLTLNESYLYGNDVTYSDGKYKLSTTQVGYSEELNNYHYTCGDTTDTCDSVKYIYYISSTTGYYITLNNGQKIEDALNDMLDNNLIPSTIKGDKDAANSIDNWYYTNIEAKTINGEKYSSYLEDTIWCNDRVISELNGFNYNGGNIKNHLYFNAKERGQTNFKPSLACKRTTDSFTVDSTNGNGKLDYPVGLLTVDELMLAGAKYNTANNKYYLYNGSIWWLGTPYYSFLGNANNFMMYPTGAIMYNSVNSTAGVRPAISLKPKTTFSGGDGTKDNPYTIEY